MYVILGTKVNNHDWQKLLPALEAVLNNLGAPENDYIQVLNGLAQDKRVVDGIGLPRRDKNQFSELKKQAHNDEQILFLGMPWSNDPGFNDLIFKEFGQELILFFYRNPEGVLAEHLWQGESPAQAEKQWLDNFKGFLGLYRQCRHKGLLLEMESASKFPRKFLKTCKQHFSLSGEIGPDFKVNRVSQPEPLCLLVARYIFAMESAEAAQLAGEIEASTTPFSDSNSSPPIDFDSILHRARELGEVKEESELLLGQLHSVQEELESYYLKNKSLEKKKASLDKALSLVSLQLDKQKEDAFQLQQKYQQLQEKLGGIRGTFAYQIVRPAINFQKNIKAKKSLRQNIRRMESSDFFDADWYVSRYPDVKEASISPELHYLLHGGFEGRDPGPFFSSTAYLARYPDVANSCINPLLHYLNYGKKEGRIPK